MPRSDSKQLWNDLGKRMSFALVCAYPLNSFSTALDGDYLVEGLRRAHPCDSS